MRTSNLIPMQRTIGLNLIVALALSGAWNCAGGAPLSPRPSTGAAVVDDERGMLALDQTLRELANPFSVMYIAACPDDVDEGALAYIHRKLGGRVVIVFVTRGENHDSAFVPATGAALGVVRTREALQVTRAIGADAFFLNLADAGYSPAADDVLRQWGHDPALARVVRAFRLLRPDVVMYGGRAWEGQAQAVKRLIAEAFDGAADPHTAATESDAWLVQRIFERTDDTRADLSINLTESDPARGRSYADLGLAAHSQIVSYGGQRWSAPRLSSSYKLVQSPPNDQFKPGVDPFSGLELPQKVRVAVTPPRLGDAGLLESIGQRERLTAPLNERLLEKRAEGSEAELRERYGAEFFRVIRYRQTLERALALILGLSLEIDVADPVVTPGQNLNIRATLHNDSGQTFPVAFESPETLPSNDATPPISTSDTLQVNPHDKIVRDFSYETKNLPVSLPLEAHLQDEEFYPIGSTLPGAQPTAPFGRRLLITADVQLDQLILPISSQARFDIAPAVEISTVPFLLVKDWNTSHDAEVVVHLKNRTSRPLSGALWVVPLAMSDESYEPAKISFPGEDAEVSLTLKLRLPLLKPPLAPDILLEFRRPKPAPPEPLGSARIVVKAVDAAAAPDLHIGIVAAADPALESALDQLGLNHEEITVAQVSRLTHGKASPNEPASGCDALKRYDAIFVDHLAYLAHPESVSMNACLLAYARAGGNLVVLGQAADLGLLRLPFSPAPLALSADRAVPLSAAVRLLDANHALLANPNHLAAVDFDGWSGDRAVYVPVSWGTEFTPLLEFGSGEGATRGALLTSRVGDGWFSYTTLNLNRQWREGGAGAYRLLGNLASLGKSPKSQTNPQ